MEAKAPVTITFWPSSNPQEIEFAKIIVARWNKENPDIQVKMEPLPASRSTEEVLLAAIAAGTTPDVCANIYPGAITQYIAGKGLYPHDELPGFYDFVYDRSPKEIVDAFTYRDGHVYQIPWKANPVMVAYNVNLLRENGIDPRSLSTYSGFLKAAEKLAKDTDGDGRIDQWLYAPSTDVTWWQRFFDFYTLYIAASGGRTLIEGDKVAFNDSGGVAAMGFLQELFRRGYAPKSTFPGDVFLQEKIATYITGPFAIPFWESMKPKGFEYDFVPLPVPDFYTGKEVWTYSDPKNIGIFQTTRHPEEAWEFVKFLLSPENDAMFLAMTSQIPFRKNLDKVEGFASIARSQPYLPRFMVQSRYTQGADNVKPLVEIYDAIAQEYQYCAVLGQETPEEAMEIAEERVNEILSY